MPNAAHLIAILMCSYALVSCSAINNAANRIPPAEIEGRFKTASNALRSSGATAELEAIRQDAPDALWKARSAYLLALNAIKTLNRTEPQRMEYVSADAAELFRQAGALDVVRDHVEYNRAISLYAGMDYTNAVSALNNFMKDRPDSVLLPKARFNLAEALAGTGSLEAARAGYDDFIARYPKDPLVAEALLKSAGISIALEEPIAAAGPLRRILVKYPATTEAKQAAIIPSQDSSVAGLLKLSVDERFERIDNLLTAARYNECAEELEGLINDDDIEIARTAALKLAAVQMRARLYSNAEATLTGLLKSGINKAAEPEALYMLAVAHMRQRALEKVAEIEKKLSRKYPLAKERAQTMLLMGRAYEERGDLGPAKDVYAKIIDIAKDERQTEEATWRSAWIDFRQSRFDDAYKILSAYKGAHESSKFAYWSARSAERAGIKEAAQQWYAEAKKLGATKYNPNESDEAAYYAKLASELTPKFKTAADNTDGNASPASQSADSAQAAHAQPADAAASPSESFLKDPHYAAALELNLLGLGDEAASELALLYERYSGDKAALYTLSEMFYGSGNLFLGLRSYRRFASSGAVANGLPFDAGALAYPPKAIELVIDTANPQKADPRLIAAIMREESAFNPIIVSRSGALGLMQIMPSTARHIAASIKDDEYDERELLTPKKSIRYGSWYIEKLLRRFDDNIVYAIAAYNAGPAAVTRWIKELPGPADEFIESIPYAETRNYTKKVLTSYSGFLKQTGSEPISFIKLLDDIKAASNSGESGQVDF